MSRPNCGWCCTDDHAESACPRIAQFGVVRSHGIVDPMSASPDDAFDALSLRMIAWRTYAGQLHRVCRESGVVIPADVEALNPDAPFEAA